MASTYLTRTLADPGGAGNRNKYTFSAWIKRSELGTNQWIFGSYQSASYQTAILFKSDDTLDFFDYYNGSFNGRRRTNRVFRDPSAWYHIVCIWDKDNATTSEKMRVYVNGIEETSFQASADPSYATTLNADGQDLSVGYKEGVGEYFNGSMSHVHFCDGYAYSASNFGQTDANGVWTIKTSPSVSYGTTGFFILKDSNSGTDQSGNGNDLTAGGTLTQTEDNPSNVFATWNPLDRWVGGTFTGTNGNTTVRGSDSHNTRFGCTLAVTSGKYYWEVKAMGSVSWGGTGVGIASIPDASTNSSSFIGNDSAALTFQTYQAPSNTLRIYIGGNYDTYNGNISVGDIINFALDMDNSGFYIGINGSWLNSGNPTSGSSKTGAVNTGTNANSFFGNMSGKTIMPVGNVQNTDYIQSNFGNGYFGTTAVSSAGTNASGNGIFEYDVPTGYTALCTKGLNGE